ncbi:hypothetical protein KGQ25_02400, partial [Patescibacteria group bacterium]|nr:hypothetical protein [Patescibacteria group bacterium]
MSKDSREKREEIPSTIPAQGLLHSPITALVLLSVLLLSVLAAFSPFLPVHPALASTISSSLSMPPNNLGLVGWWTFDGANMVSNVADSSGQGNNGNLVGYTSTTTLPGPVGQALSFNGSSQYVNVPTSSSLAITGDMTVVAWVYLNSYANYNGIVSKTGSGANQNEPAPFDVYTNQSTGYVSFYRGNGTTPGFVVSTSPVPLGKWQQIAITQQGTTVTHYLNGVPNGTGTLSASIADAGQPMLIGYRTDNATKMNGKMDDVRIYNRALSASEIIQMYNTGLGSHINTSINPPNLQNGLVGWWTFDGANMVSNVADS